MVTYGCVQCLSMRACGCVFSGAVMEDIQEVLSGLENSVKSLQKQMDSLKKASKALALEEKSSRGIHPDANCLVR